jgi:hypothetical protein
LIANSFSHKIASAHAMEVSRMLHPIRHNDAEPAPRPRVIYRCPVCRLELVVDESTNKLTVAPLSDDRRSSD